MKAKRILAFFLAAVMIICSFSASVFGTVSAVDNITLQGNDLNSAGKISFFTQDGSAVTNQWSFSDAGSGIQATVGVGGYAVIDAGSVPDGEYKMTYAFRRHNSSSAQIVFSINGAEVEGKLCDTSTTGNPSAGTYEVGNITFSNGEQNQIKLTASARGSSSSSDSNARVTVAYITLEDVSATAINNVVSLIDAIGTPVTFFSEDAVTAARTAYDALGETLKAEVSNYDVLTSAEDTLAAFNQNNYMLTGTDLNNSGKISAFNSSDSAVSFSSASTDFGIPACNIQANVGLNGYVNVDLGGIEDGLYNVYYYYRKHTESSANISVTVNNASVQNGEGSALLVNTMPSGNPEFGESSLGTIALDCGTLNKMQFKVEKQLSTGTPRISVIAVRFEKIDVASMAQVVIDKINAINPDEINLDNYSAVSDARSSYDALINEAKALVTNISALEADEAALAQMQADTITITAETLDNDGNLSAFDSESNALTLAASTGGYVASYNRQADAGVGGYMVIDLGNDYVADGKYKIYYTYRRHDSSGAKLSVTVNGTVAADENGDEIFADSSTNESPSLGVTCIGEIRLDKGDENRIIVKVEEALGNGTPRVSLVHLRLQRIEDLDKDIADSVIALIDAIGTVTVDSESAINAARTAYDALTDTQKELVSNYATLTAAEAEFARLSAPADYSAVDAAILSIPTDLSIYTDSSVLALTTARDAVVRGKIAAYQSEVDAMALAINNALNALEFKNIEMIIGISAGMVTENAAEGYYDITWNARINAGENTSYDEINLSDITFKKYGVYYAQDSAVLEDYTNADQMLIFNKVFNSGDDIDVYTQFGFRLKKVAENKVRSAMFYLEYEYNGTLYTLLSSIDSATASLNR